MNKFFEHYKSLLILIITFILILVVASLTHEFKIWEAVSALSSSIALLGVLYIAYEFALQKKEHSLNQLNFMMGLSDDFDENLSKSESARLILADDSSGRDFDQLVSALEIYYDVAAFKYRIAQLVDNEIIDIKLLKMLYERELTDDIFHCFPSLVEWSDNNHDLAANYDAKSLFSIVTAVRKLVVKLDELNEDKNDERNNLSLQTLDTCHKQMTIKVAKFHTHHS